MSCISWNCRGLGLPRSVQTLQELARDKRPNFIFLIESLCSFARLKEIKVMLDYDGFFHVDPEGRSGGFGFFFWISVQSISLIGLSHFSIDVQAEVLGLGLLRVTSFYGHPDRRYRGESWTLLRQLQLTSSLPWLVCGDFNCVLSQSEKRGGPPYPSNLINGFRSVLDDTGLHEITLHGFEFTWNNGRGGGAMVEEQWWKRRLIGFLLLNHGDSNLIIFCF